MQKLLQEISKRIILLNETEFTEDQKLSKWIGRAPVSDEEIHKTEELLQLKLPYDYTEFLKITNGFPSSNRGTGITFSPLEKIDYLFNIDEDLIEVCKDNNVLKEIGDALSKSILIGGLNEEQYFLLIPPSQVQKKWRYWEFASWIPGEWEFKSLKAYFKNELDFLQKETKGLKNPKSKQVIDYSLRDYLFNSDWENTLSTALEFLQQNKRYNYLQGEADLLKVLLLASSKLNSFDRLQRELEKFKKLNGNNTWLIQLTSSLKTGH